jgi:hypothetical protein
MNAAAELDSALRRQAQIALDHAILNLDGAAHGIDDATELDQDAVAGALDRPAVMRRDGGNDQITPQRPQPRQRPILVSSR